MISFCLLISLVSSSLERQHNNQIRYGIVQYLSTQRTEPPPPATAAAAEGEHRCACVVHNSTDRYPSKENGGIFQSLIDPLFCAWCYQAKRIWINGE
mmetsp:Transcript_47008/g.52375  ORF Transcript_47008/g.52375 Transcript_47008/m.52375 type:complete len:97 (+) Transcript_47008:207-497(+)